MMMVKSTHMYTSSHLIIVPYLLLFILTFLFQFGYLTFVLCFLEREREREHASSHVVWD